MAPYFSKKKNTMHAFLPEKLVLHVVQPSPSPSRKREGGRSVRFG